MKIDRNNYEEYFILYMDNELGSDDRRKVETFVEQHPDLKEELDLLMQYKLSPDTSIVYSGKEELMAPAANGMTNNLPVTLANYQEWLTLYIDNELTADQKKSVVLFMAAHPAVQQELTVLQQTKLQPEKIIFADKEILYRTEEKVKVVPVRWWRIAAAAVLLIAAGFTTFMVVNKRTTAVKGDIAKIPGTQQKTANENIAVKNKTVTKEEKKENKSITVPVIANSIVNPVAAISPKSKNILVADKLNTGANNKTVPNNLPAAIKKEDQVIVQTTIDKPSNNLPKPLYNTAAINNDVPKNVIASIDNPKQTPSNTSLTNPDVTTKAVQPLYTSNTSSINNDDIHQADGKKSKLRGFFRKVTRTFERKTNVDAADDDRVLIGGLAIKL